MRVAFELRLKSGVVGSRSSPVLENGLFGLCVLRDKMLLERLLVGDDLPVAVRLSFILRLTGS